MTYLKRTPSGCREFSPWHKFKCHGTYLIDLDPSQHPMDALMERVISQAPGTVKLWEGPDLLNWSELMYLTQLEGMDDLPTRHGLEAWIRAARRLGLISTSRGHIHLKGFDRDNPQFVLTQAGIDLLAIWARVEERRKELMNGCNHQVQPA